MCRLTAYTGKAFCPADLVTRPSRSVIRQSFDARERITGDGWTPPHLNGDGYGLGWYANRDDPWPCLYRAVRPAWNDTNLCNLAEKLQVTLFFAHVRAASQGMDVSENTCHPFRQGRYMWMHNGAVAQFFRIRRAILARLKGGAFDFALSCGTSDSAWCFALFLNEIEDAERPLQAHAIADALNRSFKVLEELLLQEGVEEISLLNIVLSDGRTLIATKFTIAPSRPGTGPWASLYWSSGTGYVPDREDPTKYIMTHSDRRSDLVIVTSEPLSDEIGDWTVIPADHMLIVTESLDVILLPVGVTPKSPSEPLNYLRHMDLRRSSSIEHANLPSINNLEPTHIISGKASIVSLCVSGNMLFSGTQDGPIRVWQISSKTNLPDLIGHRRGVLTLVTCKIMSRELLISGSADSSIRMWDLAQLTCVGKLDFGGHGDVYSAVVVNSTLYAGFRGVLMLSVDLHRIPGPETSSPTIIKMRMKHRGYVYSVTTCQVHQKDYICTGSGDTFVRVWDPENEEPFRTLVGHQGAVMALVATSKCLFSGSRDGTIRYWDLEGGAFLCRKAMRQGSEVLALSLSDHALFSGGEDRFVVVWCRNTLVPLYRFESSASQSLAFSSVTQVLFSGGIDDTSVSAWCTRELCQGEGFMSRSDHNDANSKEWSLEGHLRRLIRLQTVTGDRSNRDDCWECAKYLSSLLEDMGATTSLIDSTMSEGRINPLLLAKFAAPYPGAPAVVFYGHYDVQPASGHWESDPWKLTAIDGYYYARGATDNKGPILAFVAAVRDFLAETQGKLPFSINLCLEGQGESFNIGFRDSILANLQWFANTKILLTSNSYWIHDERPCLTYGMRGSMDFTITVSRPGENLHSGVDGGACAEPMDDLIAILSEMKDHRGYCRIPHFYDGVRSLTDEEARYFDEVEKDTRARVMEDDRGTKLYLRSDLEKRWCSPSLSITSLSSSNTNQAYSVIPKCVSAKISARFVPDQHPEELQGRIRQYLEYEFDKLSSSNRLEVHFEKIGDYWLSNTTVQSFEIAARAIEKNWGCPPLLVREGGTMPVTSFLMKTLNCEVVQIPLGQCSDNAHLPNERIRVLNLDRGRNVLKDFLLGLRSILHNGDVVNQELT